MALETMSEAPVQPPSETPAVSAPKPTENLDRTWREIVAKARSAPAPALGAILACGLTGLTLWASFTPLDFGALAWLSLVPITLLIRLKTNTRWMYRVCYGCGFVYSLFTLQWMRLGDPSMYIALLALSLYMAFYWPAFVYASRVAVHRFRVPLMMTVPAVWVGLEYARAYLLTGFSWYYLGHTQHNWTELIQISDLVGAYGVSFVVAMTGACLAGLVPVNWFRSLRLLPDACLVGEESQFLHVTKRPVISVVCSVIVFTAVLGYGYYRRANVTFESGPRVALIEGNFPTSVKHDPQEWGRIYHTHEGLTGQAVQYQPDVIVWPETMFREPLRDISPDVTDDELLALAPQLPEEDRQRYIDGWRAGYVRQKLFDMSGMAGAAMIIGINTLEAEPGDLKSYNSAAFVRPDLGLNGRYDKIHRVIFGEYIPLKDSLPFLKAFSPYSGDFGIEAGKEPKVFEYRGWRFSSLICFEDTVPHLVRRIVHDTTDTEDGNKPVDCLVNLTNDGWFHGSSELDQHLITASFRAVECRTPLVRAVNTGISAVIDGDGVVVEPDVFIDADERAVSSMRDPKSGRWRKSLNAALIHTVPLDPRRSFYVQFGDWFAGLCGLMVVVMLVGGVLPTPKSPAQPTAA